MTTATMDRTEKIATQLFEQQRKFAEAQREAAQSGFRPHYCIHGTNLWTDYDNICGGCEDGSFTEHSTPREVRAYARMLAEGEAAHEARRAEEVTSTIDKIVATYRSAGKLIGDPRVYRDGAAAMLVMDTTEYVLAVEIDANAHPTFRTLA